MNLSFSSFLPRRPAGTWVATTNWKLRFVYSHGTPGSRDVRTVADCATPGVEEAELESSASTDPLQACVL